MCVTVVSVAVVLGISEIKDKFPSVPDDLWGTFFHRPICCSNFLFGKTLIYVICPFLIGH